MTEASWKVYWREYTSDTYLYGSEITFHALDDVEYRNELMPPGTVIKKWYSKVNFQGNRIEPSLPIIDGESKYHISINISSQDEQCCLLLLVFYDRFGTEAGRLVIREKEMDFKCPLKTYSYEAHLINAGAKSFHFHSITIKEIEDGEQETVQNTKQSK